MYLNLFYYGPKLNITYIQKFVESCLSIASDRL